MQGREEQLPRNIKLSKCEKGGVEWTHRVKSHELSYRNGKQIEISTLKNIIFNVYVRNIGYMANMSLGLPYIEARLILEKKISFKRIF